MISKMNSIPNSIQNSMPIPMEKVQQFKKMFESQRKELLFSKAKMDLNPLEVRMEDLPDDCDRTAAELEQGMRIRLKSREALFLKKIDAALERIRSGTFGECVHCEEPIEIRRLDARPTTTHCVLCKEAQERVEHAHIDGHQYKSLGKEWKFRIV